MILRIIINAINTICVPKFMACINTIIIFLISFCSLNNICTQKAIFLDYDILKNDTLVDQGLFPYFPGCEDLSRHGSEQESCSREKIHDLILSRCKLEKNINHICEVVVYLEIAKDGDIESYSVLGLEDEKLRSRIENTLHEMSTTIRFNPMSSGGRVPICHLYIPLYFDRY